MRDEIHESSLSLPASFKSTVSSNWAPPKLVTGSWFLLLLELEQQRAVRTLQTLEGFIIGEDLRALVEGAGK